MADQEKQPPTHPTTSNRDVTTTRPYERPALTKLGKLSELTLGSGSASNESGRDKA